jgi:hypothetical protein
VEGVSSPHACITTSALDHNHDREIVPFEQVAAGKVGVATLLGTLVRLLVRIYEAISNALAMNWRRRGVGRSTGSHVPGQMFLSAEALSARFLGAHKLRGIVVLAEELRSGAGLRIGGGALLGTAGGGCGGEHGSHEVGRNGLSIHHE